MKSFVEPESLLQFKEETTIFPAGTKVRISSQVRIHDGEDGEVIKESDSRRLVRFYDGDEFWYPLNELRNYYPEDITCNLKSIPEAILMFPTDTEVEVPGGRRGRVISKMDNERLVKFKNPDYSSSAHWYRVDELSIPATIPKKLITSELKVGDRVKHNHSGDIGTVVNIHAKDDIIEYRIQYDNLTGLRWNSGGYITKLEKVKEDIDMKKSDQIEKVDTAPLITDFSFEVKGVKTDIIYSVSTEKIEFMDPILDVTKIDDFIAELNIVKDLYDRMTKG
jgi:hypothetical protein